jgi:hypothetical protein
MRRAELEPGMEVAVKVSTYQIEKGVVLDKEPLDLVYTDWGRAHFGMPDGVKYRPNRYCTVAVREWVDVAEETRVWTPRHFRLNQIMSTWERHLGFEHLRQLAEAKRREEREQAQRELDLKRKLLVSMARDAGLKVEESPEGTIRIEGSPIRPWQTDSHVSERVFFKVLKMLAEAQEELRKANGQVFIPRA